MRSLILLVPLTLLAACSKDSKASYDSKTTQAKDAVHDAVAEFKESSAKALDAIDRDIDKLREKAKSASASAKDEMQKAIDELSDKRKQVAEALEDIGDGASDAAKSALESAKSGLNSLKQGVADALDKFK